MTTLFKYRCSCGNTDNSKLSLAEAQCIRCNATYPVSSTGVILFNQNKTEQNAYFDEMYHAGWSHAKDEFQEKYVGAFHDSVLRTEDYLKSCGFDKTWPLEHLSILDAACGSGWVTAGLFQNKKVQGCKLHAFDISQDGPEMLARFEKNKKSSNHIETSTQNAEDMRFGDATFDLIIGSSILHHFDNFEGFLTDCRRILKPGGVAIFGEPFSIGYGIGAAALLIAQRQLGTHYELIESMYSDICIRNKVPRNLLKNLVDKHLFIQSTFIQAAEKTGFISVNFISPQSREYYCDHFIDELLQERGIADVYLANQANSIYKVFFDIFDNDNFVHTLGAFMHIVLKRR